MIVLDEIVLDEKTGDCAHYLDTQYHSVLLGISLALEQQNYFLKGVDTRSELGYVRAMEPHRCVTVWQKQPNPSTALARQSFVQAADDYVTSRKLELASASQAKEKQLLVQLRTYFKQEPRKLITAKRITEYRAWRSEQSVGPAILKAEMGILRRIMKRARVWARVADDIRPLREPASIGKAFWARKKSKRCLKRLWRDPNGRLLILRQSSV
jgi:hypothetical protein